MDFVLKDSNTGEPTDEGRTPGLGLLSRFLGAIFLVLVCGLFLLDRALLQANHDQTVLDAQAAALLVERLIAEDAELVERLAAMRWAEMVPFDTLSNTLRGISRRTEFRGIWFRNSNGVVHAIGSIAPQIIERIATTITKQRISVIAAHGHVELIQIRAPVQGSTGEEVGVIGLLVSPVSLQQVLERLSIPSRIALTVSAGNDTIAYLGDSRRSKQGLTEIKRTIRLPDGGAWSLASVHALTSRSIRWALWTLGIFGILFLALGLIREQKRALHAAGRSNELERLYSDVKRANQAKSEFLANVSHELRTPLNAIVGFVELLREGFYGDLSPRQVPPVDRIAASATHLRHLVDQVLDIAKIAAGRLEIHPETIVLRPFVLNIASELESLVSEKGLNFSISVGASLPRVRTDPSHLRQILINLIGNAVKYTQNGTITIRTKLIADENDWVEKADRPILKEGRWIALQVIDTGVGIATKDLERIFDEFEQVNAGPRGDSMQRGTGLGLAISRRLARLLGGEISVESEFGRGSTFTVWLPINAADLVRDPILSPIQEEQASA